MGSNRRLRTPFLLLASPSGPGCWIVADSEVGTPHLAVPDGVENFIGMPSDIGMLCQPLLGVARRFIWSKVCLRGPSLRGEPHEFTFFGRVQVFG